MRDAAAATPVPVRVLTLLFIAFGGALGMKAWEEHRTHQEVMLSQQVTEAAAVAGYTRSEILSAQAALNTSILAGNSELAKKTAGFAQIMSGPDNVSTFAELTSDNQIMVYVNDVNGQNWTGISDLAGLTPDPQGGRSFKLERTSTASTHPSYKSVNGQRFARACAPVNGTRIAVCVDTPVPPLSLMDYNRFVIYGLLLLAPLLAVIGLVNTVNSNSRKVKLERASRQEIEVRWKELEIGGQNGFWSWNTNTELFDIREKTAGMLGLGAHGEVTLGTFSEILDDANRDAVIKAVRQAAKGQNVSQHFKGAGAFSNRHFEIQGGPSSHGASGVITDITDSVRAEHRTRQSETIARSVVDAYPGPFAAWDKRHRLVTWNNAFQKMFDLPGSVLKPGATYDVVMAEAAKQVRIERPVRGNENGREMLLLSDIWLNFYDRPTAGGGLVSVGLDISPLKEQEETLLSKEKKLRRLVLELDRAQGQAQELAEKYSEQKTKAERASNAKSVFLANMSHELRTPLNAINGFSEMLIKQVFGPLGDERYVGYAEDILQSGEHLLDMINDILDMAKVEAGKMTISRRVIDPTDAVDAAVRMIQRRAADKQINLKMEMLNDIPEIEADHRAIKQMVLNLVTNAIKFTDPGGKVLVEMEQQNEFVRVSVIDTGIGIPKKDLPRLAQPFEQASADESRNSQGTGLGLALTKSFAEMHGGRFEIDSKEGVGTKVSFFLPLQPFKKTA